MKKTSSFIIKNLIKMLFLLLCVSIVSFLLLSLSPVDPLQTNVGQTALGSMSAEQIERLKSYWGVDTPPLSRYLSWFSSVIHGDFGISLIYRKSVAAVIGEKFSASLILLACAWIFSGLFGFLLGIIGGMNRGKTIDRLIRGYALITASTPSFWLGLLFLLVFSVNLGLFPIGLSVPIGMEASLVTLGDRLYHAILPGAVLSIAGIAPVALHTREKLIDILESDYVLFAIARGESRKEILLHHGLRNILLPALTLQFASLGELIGSSVLVEQVFSYPGLGQAAVAAGLGGDLPLLLGITLLSAALVFAGNFTANVCYRLIDPRMRKKIEKKGGVRK